MWACYAIPNTSLQNPGEAPLAVRTSLCGGAIAGRWVACGRETKKSAFPIWSPIAQKISD